MNTFITRYQECYVPVKNHCQWFFTHHFFASFFIIGFVVGGITKLTTEHFIFSGYQDYQVKKSFTAININQAQERIVDEQKGSLAFGQPHNICHQ